MGRARTIYAALAAVVLFAVGGLVLAISSVQIWLTLAG